MDEGVITKIDMGKIILSSTLTLCAMLLAIISLVTSIRKMGEKSLDDDVLAPYLYTVYVGLILVIMGVVTCFMALFFLLGYGFLYKPTLFCFGLTIAGILIETIVIVILTK